MQPQGHRGIVTPEAVVLEFESAGVGSRLLGQLVDLSVQIGAFIAVSILFTAAFSNTSVPTTLAVIVVVVLVFGILIGYPVGMETLWNGRTLGKAALGLRVVTTEGAPIRFRHAAIRGFLGLVDFWVTTGALAIVVVLATARNQRLGDVAAGTMVVRERSGASAPHAVSFAPPPGYEEYARSLDVATVGADQYALVRSFLLRVFSLTPAARASLAPRLAGPIAGRMRHTPPPHVHAETFLVCVAAAYQLRHGAGVEPTTAPAGPPPPPSPEEVASPAVAEDSGWTAPR